MTWIQYTICAWVVKQWDGLKKENNRSRNDCSYRRRVKSAGCCMSPGRIEATLIVVRVFTKLRSIRFLTHQQTLPPNSSRSVKNSVLNDPVQMVFFFLSDEINNSTKMRWSYHWDKCSVSCRISCVKAFHTISNLSKFWLEIKQAILLQLSAFFECLFNTT